MKTKLACALVRLASLAGATLAISGYMSGAQHRAGMRGADVVFALLAVLITTDANTNRP